MTSRAFFGPNQWKYLLIFVSECVIQEESSGDRGHHICGLATSQVVRAPERRAGEAVTQPVYSRHLNSSIVV